MIKATDVIMKFYAPGKKPFLALNKLCCEIPRGCIYGMIGANGAGNWGFRPCPTICFSTRPLTALTLS